jgi:hypothetical protein
MKDMFKSLDLALGTFRYTTSSVIPHMTALAWKLRRENIIKETPGMTKRKFLFNLSRSSYEKDWGHEYERPGIRGRMLSWILRMVPKSGPFKGLAFRAPNPQVEAMFMKSFNTTIDQYRAMLVDESTDRLNLPNENFDTGKLTAANGYLGADFAYDKLLGKLADRKFTGITADLRDNILTYYAVRKPPAPATPGTNGAENKAGEKDAKAQANWQKVTAELEQLRQVRIEVAAVR